jgi:hypothetical protein
MILSSTGRSCTRASPRFAAIPEKWGLAGYLLFEKAPVYISSVCPFLAGIGSGGCGISSLSPCWQGLAR